jgi:hypothetical protein
MGGVHPDRRRGRGRHGCGQARALRGFLANCRLLSVHIATSGGACDLNSASLNRFLSQSNAIDCADVSLVYMRYLIGRGVLQAIPLSKFKYWDKSCRSSPRASLPMVARRRNRASRRRGRTSKRSPTATPRQGTIPTRTSTASQKRTDQCVIDRPAAAAGLTGRVSNVEYQGPTIRVGIRTSDGLEAAVVLRDHIFKERLLSTGDEVIVSWPEACAHRLAA